jgi:formiminotetrahydrofolate cyclodeaminase
MFDASQTIGEFLEAAAAKQPTPGGGSVTALVGALAAAMGEMAVRYSIGKKSLSAFDVEQKECLAELTRARAMLVQLMVEDQTAYEAITQVRKLPPDAPQRQERFDAALLACIRVPQSMAAVGVAVLGLCDRLINMVNYHLLSDLAVCADLAMATTRCALYSVRVNLGDLDQAQRKSFEAATFSLLGHGADLIKNVSPRIWERYSRGS